MAMESTPSESGPGPLRITEPGAPSSFTTGHPPEAGVIDSPISPASPNALARFEFEAGRGNEGSKILMVEWDPEPTGEDGWVVTWEGKKTTFQVNEKVEDEDESVEEKVEAGIQQRRQRVYFLLPSDVAVPPVVTISHAGSGRALTAKSMPAIFAPGLGVGSRDAGRRGVLHTVWARLRAAQLQDEIRAELKDNSESVGLEMAVQERLWIIDHFGLDDLRLQEASLAAAAVPVSSLPPASPRSPIGGRLGEKLRGLKLATSPSDLANPLGTHFSQQNPHLQGPDHPPPPNKRGDEVTPPRTGADPVAGVASLDAVLGGNHTQVAAEPPATQSKETEDELFALPMSPRSPDMKTKSPFGLLR
ncbi:uncharacterized protein GGS22DRAFT_71678 [Annulohypoxylon maeteangense]|uniref:uncharacterized protein n=1 Tax=Annulohypoxylon maeteangense TaxID=1927788 RepID=UPI0020081A62|nr:uncharacterized protein GGS22DRAFT_71678 [Annulohypoxylon maeteangense]KAI0889481.1 hypothetical protein GGS22DRAFT_71678 [Annulohypoxylon maeteangense]